MFSRALSRLGLAAAEFWALGTSKAAAKPLLGWGGLVSAVGCWVRVYSNGREAVSEMPAFGGGRGAACTGGVGPSAACYGAENGSDLSGHLCPSQIPNPRPPGATPSPLCRHTSPAGSVMWGAQCLPCCTAMGMRGAWACSPTCFRPCRPCFAWLWCGLLGEAGLFLAPLLRDRQQGPGCF